LEVDVLWLVGEEALAQTANNWTIAQLDCFWGITMKTGHCSKSESIETLASTLAYESRELKFGTSGRRGRVADLTQLEIYICAKAELEYLQSLPAEDGGILKGESLYFGYDLRPSSTAFVSQEKGRGEIVQAIVRAICDTGMQPVNCGPIPTPALALYALSQRKASMMITGSHIPFDRNGYKTYTSRGELLKEHEIPIQGYVDQIRERSYNQSHIASDFNERGMFKVGHLDLPIEDRVAVDAYKCRYFDFFAGSSLAGMRILLYQHSAVGRDLLVDILRTFGAEVIPAGRTEEFIPIDTEDIDAARLAKIRALTTETTRIHGSVDAILSTDGDSDRPLLLCVEPGTDRVCFIGGDLLGMIAAEFLEADSVIVPITCNDGIDRGTLASKLGSKTRVGSPYVISGINDALRSGKKRICGWEANGGFLTGSAITRNARTLVPLPTRDAVLPLLCALLSAREKRLTLHDLLAHLPRRFSRAGLIKQFPRAVSLLIVRRYTCTDTRISQVEFHGSEVKIQRDNGRPYAASPDTAAELRSIRDRLSAFFTAEKGFTEIKGLNYIDGVRIQFTNGDVAHLRPSGNADEFRIYAVADTPERVEEIVSSVLAETDGIIRALEEAETRSR
jgi:phosphomannomutase